jgi:predicted AlkP superfamily pyrophosphatase or phosphodiesterase
MPNISEILPAAVNALLHHSGGAGLALPNSDAVVVLLIDGMGHRNLEQAAWWGIDVGNLLASAPIDATFPTTTPVSLASLGTGTLPGSHGFVGATFLIPELDVFLQPLKWQSEPSAVAVQPDATWFEKAERSGVAVTRIGPAAYADSGLTRSVLRGGEHVPADSLAELKLAIAASLSQARPHLIYAYYPTLDKVGHVHGVDSDEWRLEMSSVAQFINELTELLGPRQTVCITADHGMIDVTSRIWIEDSPNLMRDVRFITGEPRMRHVFAQPGYESSLHRAWLSLSESTDIYTREEFIHSGLLGEVEPDIADRIGDVVAISRGGSALASHTIDERVSLLVGNHGGDSETERQIPFVVMAG